MLAIKNNMMAAGAARNLGVNYDNLATSVQRLSSGLRINSAKDDAAGLAVRELIRADVAALDQGSRNANDGVSMLQTAEGALGEIDAVLVRMRELTEQANTDTYSTAQKQIMQEEFNELAEEIDRIVASTDFNGNNMLSEAKEFKISLGGGRDNGLTINSQKMNAAELGVGGTVETATGPSVASKDTAYLVGDDAADDVTFTIGYGTGGDSEALTITLGDASKTLQETVDLVNAASDTAQSGWSAASIEGNDTTGYRMVLKSHTAGDATTAFAVAVTGAPVWGDDVAGVGGDAVSALAADFLATDGAGVAQLDITQDASIDTIDAAISKKDTYRAELGYKMNRLETAASVLNVQSENLSAAESRISDVDVATEMSAMTRNQVLAQAGISMLGQANSMPQMALSLLQG